VKARDLKARDRVGDYIVKDCELLEGPMAQFHTMGPADSATGLSTIIDFAQKPAFEIVLVYLEAAPFGPDENYAPIRLSQQWRWYRADAEVE
jgi:hypothetical protein